jgi:hypothetical protein
VDAGQTLAVNPREYVIEKQVLWARRRGIGLGGPFRYAVSPIERERGRKVWVHALEDNLFEPLTTEARKAFESADGGELYADEPGRGNMYALHSSSAVACNLFHYWHRLGEIGPILRACGLPSTGASSLDFEAKLPIAEHFTRPPNVDSAVTYRAGRLKVAAIECKFCEPYGRPHAGLDPAYLELEDHWTQLPHTRRLAATISPDDQRFERFHAAQVVKHILGLMRAHGTDGFRLLYLWYDAFGTEAVGHRQEVEEFAATAREDGVAFQATTYQDVIVRLARGERANHQSYIDYMVERYL